MKVKLTGKFLDDVAPAFEDLYIEAQTGLTDVEYISLIDKINSAPRTKRGKGYSIEVDLSDVEVRLLANEAKYRAEFNSREYLDDDLPIDHAANRAAVKVLDQLEKADA